MFLGNFNRVQEQRFLASSLRKWLLEPNGPLLVTVGSTGLEGLLPSERVESHQALPYSAYRQLLASCQLAILPLQCGEPQSCKTPIKWLEAAAESVAVVAGPELYGPWLEHSRYGLTASSLAEIIPLARQLGGTASPTAGDCWTGSCACTAVSFGDFVALAYGPVSPLGPNLGHLGARS